MVIVMMGVSGAGKTHVGQDLARSLGWAFFDADEFHSAGNIEKMRAAIPLTDEDRGPWLAALRALVADLDERGKDAVLACSALRKEFRERLSEAGDVRFVLLSADAALLDERLRRREGHYMPADLLASQLDALEPPDDALLLDASKTPAELVEEILTALGLDGSFQNRTLPS